MAEAKHRGFNPDPWVWRRLRRSKALHAIRDDQWLPLFPIRTACGVRKTFPAGTDYATGSRKCQHCESKIRSARRADE